MSKEKFCGVPSYPVLIPYSDLEKLLDAARNYEKVALDLSRFRDEVERIREIQIEMMEKIGEIERYL